MKFSTLCLAGSLGLNVVLAALLIVGFNGAVTPTVAHARPTLPVVSEKIETAPGGETWEGLKSGTLSDQRDRLRAEGFPPDRIRTILAAQIRESFAARRKALEAAQANAPFWKNPVLDPKVQNEFRELAKLEQQALKDLLGPDRENGYAATLQRQLPNVAPEKIDQLAAIRDRYEEQRQDIYAQARNVITPDERDKMTALDKAMHAEFATVLSPSELEDYDLRNSNSATQLRYNLTAFDPTEAEFRALYKLQSAFDDQYRMTSGPVAQDVMRGRNDAQKKMNDDIAALFGPARYAEYQRATDYDYRQTTLLVGRLELPPDTANQVYAVQKEFTQRAADVGMGSGTRPNVAELRQQLDTLAAEAQTRLTALLGPTGYDAYQQYGGQWMRNMRLRVSAPTPLPTR